ncbi:hypothetical protein A9Q99_06075 [Gammaproteobacteria bacterium 45_16_T64]|nr:hypothetical protein A9Q99_06075 [Gammaproteobacteria bacterium 45_16_T64]
MDRLIVGAGAHVWSREQMREEMLLVLDQSNPSIFFERLHVLGVLAEWIPELDCLFGVPQPIKHHPEVDTGVHTMMVVDIAQARFDHPIVTWAALLHDLGKGLTPKDEWPSHRLHEIRGVKPIKAVGERLDIPQEYTELAALVSEHHLRCHKLLEMRPRSVMRLLEALDAIDNIDRLRLFAQVCEADACGRLGFEKRYYPQSQLLVECAEAARGVDTYALQQETKEVRNLPEKIRRFRISAIRQVMAEYRKTSRAA